MSRNLARVTPLPPISLAVPAIDVIAGLSRALDISEGPRPATPRARA